MKNIFYFLLSAFLIFFMTSCGGIKPSGTKSASSLYETFYVGEAGIQYFIKPLRFESATKSSVETDFTFRVKKEIQPRDSVIVNFSLFSSKVIKEIDSLVIQSNGKRCVLPYKEYIYTEKEGNLFVSRFSTKGKLSSLETVFQDANWEILLYSSETKKEKFNISNKTEKKIMKINSNLFSVL